MCNTIIKITDLFSRWPLVVNAVAGISLLVLCLTLAIFILVLILRIRNTFRNKYQLRFKRDWREVMLKWMDGEKTELVKLGLKDSILLMEYWYDIRRLIDDSSAAGLNDFAVTTRLDDIVSRILQFRTYNAENHKVWLQLIAVKVARYMYTETAIQALIRASESSNFKVNIEATCALVELEHESAELSVLSSLMQFNHWVPYIAAKVSLSGGSDILHLVGTQMDRFDDQQARNLISLTESSSDRSLLPMLVEILEKSDDIQAQASILRTLGRLGDHRHVKYIKPYLGHSNSILRIRALVSIGKLGDTDDLASILPLLSNDNWWIRYRAAESYLLLAHLSEEGFKQLLNRTSSDPARQMLNHVYAELKYA